METKLKTALNNIKSLEFDSSKIKVYCLAILTIFFALYASFSLRVFLFEPNLSYVSSLLFAFGLFALFFFFQSWTIKENNLLIFFIVLEVFSFLIFFLKYLTTWTFLIGFSLFVLWLFWGVKIVRNEHDRGIRFSITQMASLGYPKFISAFTFFILGVYFSFLQYDANFISKGAFDKLLYFSELPISHFYPGFSFNDNYDTAIAKIVERNNDSLPSLKVLTPYQRKLLLNDQIESTKLQLESKYLKREVDNSEIISNILYETTGSFVKGVNFVNAGPWLLLIALLFFWGVRSFGYILYWLLYLLSWIIFLILKKIGILNISIEMREKEIISLG